GLWRSDTLYSTIEQQAGLRGDKVFGTDGTTSLTYRELHEQTLELAVGMRRHGIGPGDRVIMQLPNWTEFFVISAAISRIGAIIVPIMPIYRRDEVNYILERSGAKMAFTAREFRRFAHGELFVDLAKTSETL